MFKYVRLNQYCLVGQLDKTYKDSLMAFDLLLQNHSYFKCKVKECGLAVSKCLKSRILHLYLYLLIKLKSEKMRVLSVFAKVR